VKDKGLLEFEGEVIDVLPAQMFKVLLENGHTITAYTGGKLKKNKIRMIRGDRVSVEISPYDLTKGRIVYRLKR
jgi:translation initiation factor IF-1|tara:strand:- start:3639 stop:3860 length:222 start_codon:yes stop_codon:yes gene_type:complete